MIVDPEIDGIEGIGKLLEKVRVSKNLTRAQLSDLSSIPAISISKYEKAGQPGGQYPPIKKLAKLALALEIDGNTLLAACFDTEAEAERWWQLHHDQGADAAAKALVSALTADKTQARQLGQYLIHTANKKPEEASLATSSSGSNPKTPNVKKESDDGQPSD